MSPDEPILSPEELEALSGHAGPGPAAGLVGLPDPAEPPVIAYDLTSEDRPVRGHLPTLDLIHVGLAEAFGASLERSIGEAVRVTSDDAQLAKLGACLSFIPSPSCICVVELQPIGEPALVVVEPALVLGLMTRSYGGADVPTAELARSLDRPPTPVERDYGRRICERFGHAMRTAWAPVAPLHLRVSSIAFSPRFATIVPAGDIVATSVFEVSAGAISGQVQFIVPYASLRPYHSVLQSPVRHGESQRARTWQEQMEDHVGAIEVEVMAELGRTTLPMGRLARLAAGHVLRLANDEQEPIVLYVEGAPKALGTLIVQNGNIAIRLCALLDAPESSDAAPHETEQEESPEEEVAA